MPHSGAQVSVRVTCHSTHTHLTLPSLFCFSSQAHLPNPWGGLNTWCPETQPLQEQCTESMTVTLSFDPWLPETPSSCVETSYSFHHCPTFSGLLIPADNVALLGSRVTIRLV